MRILLWRRKDTGDRRQLSGVRISLLSVRGQNFHVALHFTLVQGKLGSIAMASSCPFSTFQ
jgi:hypothetical protein